MSVEIINNVSPYVLDYIAGITDKLPALTRKNADFIEAVVHLDSNYAKDLEINPPSDRYDPELNAESSKGKYCGSTAYWFNEMKKTNCNFRKCVLGAVIAIDSTNSTHLESSESGRKLMRDVICKNCNGWQELVEMLNVPFEPKNHKHIISLLTAKTTAKKDGGPRYNISFATKFCAYAAIFLNSKIKYSKYDNIVSNALPSYQKVYLNETKKTCEYEICECQTRKLDDDGKYQYRLDVYEKYGNTISKILRKLSLEGIHLSLEEFDHIVWYGLKG